MAYDTKASLNRAFAALRKQGLLARQNYKCCGSCAGYSLACDAEALKAKGRTVAGCVFYTRQDAKHLDLDYAEAKLLIRYGCLHTAKYGEIGLPTEEVGQRVVAALNAEGLVTEWNGDAYTAITVML